MGSYLFWARIQYISHNFLRLNLNWNKRVWSFFCVLLCISEIRCVRPYSLPWWTCWQTPWRRRDPPGSGKTWWQRAVARRASLGAAAGERRRRGKETGRLASRNRPAADTAARTDAHEHRHPEGGQTRDYQYTGPNEVKSAAGGVQSLDVRYGCWVAFRI